MSAEHAPAAETTASKVTYDKSLTSAFVLAPIGHLIEDLFKSYANDNAGHDEEHHDTPHVEGHGDTSHGADPHHGAPGAKHDDQHHGEKTGDKPHDTHDPHATEGGDPAHANDNAAHPPTAAHSKKVA